jgi:predicted nucleic acid binding AN1-type Zn finger protein
MHMWQATMTAGAGGAAGTGHGCASHQLPEVCVIEQRRASRHAAEAKHDIAPLAG